MPGCGRRASGSSRSWGGRRSGEFDQAIRNFETLPYEEYTKWVTAPSPVVDASGNKFFVSADADLFVYVGGDGPDHRVLVKRLDRPDLA